MYAVYSEVLADDLTCTASSERREGRRIFEDATAPDSNYIRQKSTSAFLLACSGRV